MIIHTAKPDFNVNRLDAILDSDEFNVTDLELIDALIDRANERGVQVQFTNSQRTISLGEAFAIRHEMGLDIR
jgi:hypothetical protein